MSRFLSLSLGLVLCTLFAGLFVSSSASAASDYDDVIQTTNILMYSQVGEDPIDVSNDYMNYFDDGCEEAVIQGYPNGCTDFYDARDNENGRWFVTNYKNGSNYEIFITYTHDYTTACEIGFHTQHPNQYKELACELPATFRYNGWKQLHLFSNGMAFQNYASTYINREGVTNFETFIANYSIEYPPGYEGEIPPESTDEVDTRTVVAPDFAYAWNNYDITATDHNNDLPEFVPDEGYTFKGYEVEWKLFQCSGEFDPQFYTCDGTISLVDDSYKLQLQEEEYNVTVPEYSSYILEAQYLVQQCYRYPSYPATPDYCFYVDLNTEFEDYRFELRRVLIEIDGGSGSGDTLDLECDVSGMCSEAKIDCTTYDNFVLKLSCMAEQNLNYGLLNPSLFAIRDFFRSLTVPDSPQCRIQLIDVTIQGQVFQASSFGSVACSKASDIRSSFPIVPTLLNFSLGLFVIWMIVRIFNKVTKKQDDNIIEDL